MIDVHVVPNYIPSATVPRDYAWYISKVVCLGKYKILTHCCAFFQLEQLEKTYSKYNAVTWQITPRVAWIFAPPTASRHRKPFMSVPPSLFLVCAVYHRDQGDFKCMWEKYPKYNSLKTHTLPYPSRFWEGYKRNRFFAFNSFNILSSTRQVIK